MGFEKALFWFVEEELTRNSFCSRSYVASTNNAKRRRKREAGIHSENGMHSTCRQSSESFRCVCLHVSDDSVLVHPVELI